MIFTCTKQLRFAHCDPAGIVFYPRYAELCNEVVEDWFREGLGVDFYTLHEKLHLGIPTVRLSIEYRAPSHYGDSLDFALWVDKIGNSSLELVIAARCQGSERVRINLKVVMADIKAMRSVVIDEVWRARYAKFLLEDLETSQCAA